MEEGLDSVVEHNDVNSIGRRGFISSMAGIAALILGIPEAEAAGKWNVSHAMFSVTNRKDKTRKSDEEISRGLDALKHEYDKLMSLDLPSTYKETLCIEETAQGNYALVSRVNLDRRAAWKKSQEIKATTKKAGIDASIRAECACKVIHPPKYAGTTTTPSPAPEPQKPRVKPAPAETPTPKSDAVERAPAARSDTRIPSLRNNPDYIATTRFNLLDIEVNLLCQLNIERNNKVIPDNTKGYFYVELLGYVNPDTEAIPVDENADKTLPLSSIARYWQDLYKRRTGKESSQSTNTVRGIANLVKSVYNAYRSGNDTKNLFGRTQGSLSAYLPKSVKSVTMSGSDGEAGVFAFMTKDGKMQVYSMVAVLKGNISRKNRSDVMKRLSQLVYESMKTDYRPR